MVPQDLRSRLLSAGLAMLDAGTSEVSIRNVARACGVSAMAPYRHFPDKAALLGAMAGHGFDTLRSELEAADAGMDGPQALVAQGRAYIAFALRRPALFRLMFQGEAVTCLPDEVHRGAFEVLERRVAALAQRAAPVDALACWALVHGLATLALDGRINPSADLQQAVLERLAAGLA